MREDIQGRRLKSGEQTKTGEHSRAGGRSRQKSIKAGTQKKKYSDQKGSSREFLRAGKSLRYSEGTTTNWQRLEGMNRS